jgi:hypothetical protein
MTLSIRAVRDSLRRQIRGCLFWIAVCVAVFYVDSSNRNFDDFLFCLFLAVPGGIVLQFVFGVLRFALLPRRA